MFKWMQTLRRRREVGSAREPREEDRDTGDEEYEAHEEEARESAPDGMPRVKTDKL